MNPPLVSVNVATDHREPDLGQCLEGILAQMTSFPFEGVVGEDGSADGTRAIAEAYAQAHPGGRSRRGPFCCAGYPVRALARLRHPGTGADLSRP